MPAFDFDRIIERRGGDSIKWSRYADRDVLPLWVADMDFASPPAVLDALRRRIEHGVFGYAAPWPALLEAVRDHLQRHYGWRIEPEWMVWMPGIVAALNVACRAVGQAGDGVFTSTPVYPPFLSSPGLSARRLVTAPLRQRADRWEFDFAAVDQVLDQVKLWLLCHPHNPVGRAWEESELHEVARLARRHDLIVCSDEIHCGLVLDDTVRHKPFAALSEDAARRSITLMAPSKTFNLPGLYSAFAIIPDAQLRKKFVAVMDGIMPHVNTLGLVAAEGAKFAVSGINVGLFCSTPSVALGRAMGRKQAMEMLLTGDFIDAAEAQRRGLINRVVPLDQLDAEVKKLTDSICAKSAVAVGMGKQMFYKQLEMGLDGAYQLASETMACNMMADDAAEGIDAFMQKRKPEWKGC